MFIKDWKKDYGCVETRCTRCGGARFVSFCKTCGDLEKHDDEIRRKCMEIACVALHEIDLHMLTLGTHDPRRNETKQPVIQMDKAQDFMRISIMDKG